jgi:hypothetical protein
MHALLCRSLLGLALSALAACSTNAMGTGDFGAGGSGGASGSGGTGGATLKIAFDKPDPWMLEPSEQQDLKVTVSPDMAGQTVRFALLDGAEGPGSVADAALNLTETETNAEGEATVTLTAPSTPTKFDLRAMVGGVHATLSVAVEANGKARLVVEPSYAGGRTITRWVAEVYEDEALTCADLKGNPPEGDPLEGPTPTHSVLVDAGDPIVIDEVSVGKKLTVTLRADHFAGGCSGLQGVLEGQANTVLVTVTNRPIQLDQSKVTLELGLRDQEDAITSGMQAVIEAAREALLGDAETDAAALLDAMAEEATAGGFCSGNRFENARESNAWDDKLTMALGADATASIRDDFAAWLEAGIPSLARDRAFVGTLESLADVPGGAELTLDSVAGFDASDVGVEESVECTWKADADDKVVLGATLSFNPGALLVLAAREPAVADESDATALEGALALHRGRCDTVTATLTANGQGIDQSCLPCDVGCTRLLCERGLARLVGRASSSLAGEAELRIAATGAAKVGEQAELQALEGTWVGDLDAADTPSELSGALSAEGDY